MPDNQAGPKKQVTVTDSQVGVIGDHAQIKEIHFHEAAPSPPPKPPFMAEPLEGFIPRPAEFERLIAHLLDENRETPTALTAALRGAGGYGKTVLARALCHDERVRRAFPDGILWVTLGQTPDVLRELLKLYAALTGQRPAFVDVEDAANGLAAQLDSKECLMVVDDVWRSVHLRPFLRGGERCARLVTTRDGATLPPAARTVDVDAMQQDEAVALLGVGLLPADEGALRVLTARLGEWPLLLKLVNGQLRRRVRELGQPLPDALADVHAALDRRGLTAFDARDATERDQAVAQTVGLSLEMLDPEERDRYGELAIFPEDTDVPLPVLEKLWGLDGFEVKELCARFWGLALLLRFDLAEGAIRLHDVMHAYLAREHAAPLPAYHARLLDAYAKDVDDWAALPPDEHYLWRRLAYHLYEAGRGEELDALLLDFDWLLAKLTATDVNALLTDYEFPLSQHRERGLGGEGLSLVQSAIRLSAHVLARDHTQLPGQLLGRLLSFSQPQIRALLDAATQYRGSPWLRPLTPTLTPPGGPLLRTLFGHTSSVNAVAVIPDGRRAVSASSDRTLKVWDLERGKELGTLTGHTDLVMAVAVTPDGQRVVSASDDRTLKVWNLENGEELRTLTGHTDWVRAVAVTPDGQRVVSASSDQTLKVWDLESGEELRTLTGHTGWIWTVVVMGDGRRAISASRDWTLKVWDLERGEELHTLTTRTAPVNALAVMPDGKRAVSASTDWALEVWDLEQGKVLRTLTGHTDSIWAVTVMGDGRRAISASDDRTLKVWDLERREELRTLMGHTDSVKGVAVTEDGQRAISASSDRTLKVWDLERGEELYTLMTGYFDWVNAMAVKGDGQWAILASPDRILKVWDLERGEELYTLMTGHTDLVRAVAMTGDGRWAVSASRDRTLKVWNLERREELCTLTGHRRTANAVAVTGDGRRAVSASDDWTLKVWNLKQGEELRTLTGHTATVMAVAMTGDGRRAVSASGDRTLKVWNLEQGEEMRTLMGHTAAVVAVAVTRDGRRAVSVSNDWTLKVWDLESGEFVAAFSGEGALRACAVAPDGTIVAGGRSGRVHFLRLVGA